MSKHALKVGLLAVCLMTAPGLHSQNSVSLHELDKAIAVQKAEHAKDIAYLETARQLQAAEYERRLEILNHEAEQLKSMQATYLPREQWEETIRGLVAYRDQLIGRQEIVTLITAALTALLVNWVSKRWKV